MNVLTSNYMPVPFFGISTRADSIIYSGESLIYFIEDRYKKDIERKNSGEENGL